MGQKEDDRVIALQEKSKKRFKAEMKNLKSRFRKNVIANITARCNEKESAVMERILRADFEIKKPKNKKVKSKTPLSKIKFYSATKVDKPVPRQIIRVPELPDEPTKTFVRPPAVYDQIKSPFGLASELLLEQLKKHG